jgi:hypothetical protein
MKVHTRFYYFLSNYNLKVNLQVVTLREILSLNAHLGQNDHIKYATKRKGKNLCESTLQQYILESFKGKQLHSLSPPSRSHMSKRPRCHRCVGKGGESARRSPDSDPQQCATTILVSWLRSPPPSRYASFIATMSRNSP